MSEHNSIAPILFVVGYKGYRQKSLVTSQITMNLKYTRNCLSELKTVLMHNTGIKPCTLTSALAYNSGVGRGNTFDVSTGNW